MGVQSRIEQLMQRIIDGYTDLPEGGIQSRVEALLVYIITNGTHSEQEILEILESLKNGIKYMGQIDYYKDLPTTAEVGHAYTVKYKGESGNVEDGTEYVWGKYDGTDQWIKLGSESYPTTTQTVDTTVTLKSNDTVIVTGSPTAISVTIGKPENGKDFITGLNFKVGANFALTDTAPTGFSIVWSDEPTWITGNIYEIIYRCLWVKNESDNYIISATYKEVSLS